MFRNIDSEWSTTASLYAETKHFGEKRGHGPSLRIQECEPDTKNFLVIMSCCHRYQYPHQPPTVTPPPSSPPPHNAAPRSPSEKIASAMLARWMVCGILWNVVRKSDFAYSFILALL
jgi:hypothetical protein